MIPARKTSSTAPRRRHDITSSANAAAVPSSSVRNSAGKTVSTLFST
jgi:hypothetical protein